MSMTTSAMMIPKPKDKPSTTKLAAIGQTMTAKGTHTHRKAIMIAARNPKAHMIKAPSFKFSRSKEPEILNDPRNESVQYDAD
jgi:hypothetical protein